MKKLIHSYAQEVLGCMDVTVSMYLDEEKLEIWAEAEVKGETLTAFWEII